MSPGSFPKNGMPLFLNKSNKAPSAAIIIPKTIRNFAICCMMSDIEKMQKKSCSINYATFDSLLATTVTSTVN